MNSRGMMKLSLFWPSGGTSDTHDSTDSRGLRETMLIAVWWKGTLLSGDACKYVDYQICSTLLVLVDSGVIVQWSTVEVFCEHEEAKLRQESHWRIGGKFSSIRDFWSGAHVWDFTAVIPDRTGTLQLMLSISGSVIGLPGFLHFFSPSSDELRS